MNYKMREGNDIYIHAGHPLSDLTLCMLALEGDPPNDIHFIKDTTLPIDCPDCIGIIKYCKKIRIKED